MHHFLHYKLRKLTLGSERFTESESVLFSTDVLHKEAQPTLHVHAHLDAFSRMLKSKVQVPNKKQQQVLAAHQQVGDF